MTKRMIVFSALLLATLLGFSERKAYANAWDHCRVCIQASDKDNCGSWKPVVCSSYGDSSALSSVADKHKCLKVMLDCQEPRPNCRLCFQGYYGDHCGSSDQDCTPYGGGWSPVIRKAGNADAIKCGRIAVDCGTGALPYCGNGAREAGEECDLGSSGNGGCPAACSTACRTNDCGACVADGSSFTSADPSECGNRCCNGTCSSSTYVYQGCSGSWSNTCGPAGAPVCGNSVQEAGEACDNGATYNGACPAASCSTSCTINACTACTASGNTFITAAGNPADCTATCCSGSCSSIVPEGAGCYGSIYVHTCA